MQISTCVFSFCLFCILFRRKGSKDDHSAVFPLLCLFVHILPYKFIFLKEDALLHLGEFQLIPLKYFKSVLCSSSFYIIS